MTDGTALHNSFTFTFMRRGKGGTNQAPAKEEVVAGSPQGESGTVAYESSIRTIASVKTVESFWEVYNYLKRPSDLPTTTDYHFFRNGIKPTWEDSNNAKGGKWIVRLPKGLASRYWEEMILALIGGQLSPGLIPNDEVCGCVLSVRYAEDILGVWNKTATDREMVERIRDAIKKCLQLPSHANMEYKPHQTSIADRSSFRNTQVWKPKSLEGRSSSVGSENMSTSPGGGGGGGGGGPMGSIAAHTEGGRGSVPPRRSTFAGKPRGW
eukprot:CAMPEP_0168734724 /NCGR_PEP_ID=MMETSP0724-20121128/8962_1 /TAXON_ID=265536 /ORGANISM="Amphiprora sp., Strain CCMP467" /LENGTH=266 /DNA_ID=CAMNT_0008781839 /DNA_START=44 /DNA_END=841 /DNA_ORIENTATION=+